MSYMLQDDQRDFLLQYLGNMKGEISFNMMAQPVAILKSLERVVPTPDIVPDKKVDSVK